MSNVLVACFSASGVTKAVGQKLAEAATADFYEIRPEVPYTRDDLDWMNKKSRSTLEMEDKSSRPALADKNADVKKYDTIFLGFPIWWYVAPTIINSFLESYDFSGKTVYTFCTSGSSGIETSVANLQKLYPDVNIVSGNRFEVKAGKDVIASWIEELN